MAVQYSIQKMVSDGTLSTIALGIQYLQRNDIYMRIAGEETPQIGTPSGYTWAFINSTTLKILPVVPNGVEVVVYRRTDADAMYNIYSQNAQFDEATIDENNQQLLYIAQEYLEQGIPGAGVDTIEFLRDDGSSTYYRIKRTDGSYSEEFTVPSVGSITKILAREALRRSYAEAGYNLVGGSFKAGFTLVNSADVALDEATGKALSGSAGTYPENTSTAGFDDVSGALLRNSVVLHGSGEVLDDTVRILDAIARTPVGGTLTLIGFARFTDTITISKRISVLCKSATDAFIVDVGTAKDGLVFAGPAAGINAINCAINVYGKPNSCKNGVIFERVDRSKILTNVRCGATEYGQKYLGCLLNQIAIESSVNYLPPFAGVGNQVDHVFLGKDTKGYNVYTNANDIFVNLEGFRHGIVTDDLNSQGDNAIRGTIEGLSGRPFNILNSYGMALGCGDQLHLEANGQSGLLTNCKSTSIDGTSAGVVGVQLVGCRSTFVNRYTGSLNVDETSIGTKYGSLYLQAAHVFNDLSISSEAAMGSAATAGGTNFMRGLVGRSPMENLFHNPFMDIWDNGAFSSPAGVTLVDATASRNTSLFYDGNPGLCSASFAVTGSAITAGPSLKMKAPWINKSQDRWVSIMIPIYVPSGQPNVRCYVLVSGQFVFIEDVTAKDKWVVVRGSVFAEKGKDVIVTPRVYNGSSFLPGNFLIGGLSIVEGAAAPKSLCDSGKRNEHIVSSVGAAPSFVGQRALVGGIWYMASGTSGVGDWKQLN